MTTDLGTKDQKQAFKEAINEWLDNKFMLFGKYTFGSLLAAAFAGLIYLAIYSLPIHVFK
jgi:1,2-phenylacetyl-CoA epoxidase catalytic subunit